MMDENFISKVIHKQGNEKLSVNIEINSDVDAWSEKSDGKEDLEHEFGFSDEEKTSKSMGSLKDTDSSEEEGNEQNLG